MTSESNRQAAAGHASDTAPRRLPALHLLRIPVGEDYVVGRLYSPAGEGPHPTIVLLHGFPGTQSNHDLAAGLQQAGYQTLVFHYRGCWGSTGNSSVAHALEDVETVLRYLRSPGVSGQYGVDTDRIALAGHSFGGFLTIMTAAKDPSIPACLSIAGVNFGWMGEAMSRSVAVRESIETTFEYATTFVTGYSKKDISRELIANYENWNLLRCVPQLAYRPVLLLASDNDETTPKNVNHDPLVQAFESVEGNRMEQRVMENTDHGFEGKRGELCRIVLEWLLRVLPIEAAEAERGEE
ncbi:alpha/beta hydrolase family protein [Paenibacillus soyae]|uniref:Alpha/beta fold hydrolase n=1 Tax=Paenibacillus soyae TaxID=2969249 RepID=A0A9X2SBS8_9BACL|nr:alpha/beta fold hydrolase [Paenibacillus soyae]MCR2807350.1 alpha/beta fold hydrolase [Paenibacillus soyae]